MAAITRGAATRIKTICRGIANSAIIVSPSRTAMPPTRTSRFERKSCHAGVRVANAITGIAITSSAIGMVRAAARIAGRSCLFAVKGPDRLQAAATATAHPAMHADCPLLKSVLVSGFFCRIWAINTARVTEMMSQSPGSNAKPKRRTASSILTNWRLDLIRICMGTRLVIRVAPVRLATRSHGGCVALAEARIVQRAQLTDRPPRTTTRPTVFINRRSVSSVPALIHPPFGRRWCGLRSQPKRIHRCSTACPCRSRTLSAPVRRLGHRSLLPRVFLDLERSVR